jgi:hypothetical protein
MGDAQINWSDTLCGQGADRYGVHRCFNHERDGLALVAQASALAARLLQ